MNIAYAVHHLPPRYTGGAEQRAWRTARWFQVRGHAASLIAIESINRDAPACADFIESGLSVRRLSFDHQSFSDSRSWTYDNSLVERRVGEFLAEQCPDVFHLFSGYLMTAGAIRAARTAGLPIVISLTDFWFLCPRITLLRSDGTLCPRPPADPLACVRCQSEEQRRFRWPAQALPRPAAGAAWRMLKVILPSVQRRVHYIRQRRETLSWALDQADALICPSRFLRERFIEHGVAADKLHRMRQGLNLPAQLPGRGSANAQLVIGYRGQIKSHKGLDLLIEAGRSLAARGYRFTLAIYGDEFEDPRYAAELKRRAQGADWIEWRGVYVANAVWDVLTGLDVVVVPSRWYENSPNTILEAQAMNIPVVATNLGGMAELVHHDGDGLLFRPNDPGDLSGQLARLLDEPGLLERLSANAPAVKTLDAEMGELLDLYQRIAAKSAVAIHR